MYISRERPRYAPRVQRHSDAPASVYVCVSLTKFSNASKCNIRVPNFLRPIWMFKALRGTEWCAVAVWNTQGDLLLLLIVLLRAETRDLSIKAPNPSFETYRFEFEGAENVHSEAIRTPSLIQISECRRSLNSPMNENKCHRIVDCQVLYRSVAHQPRITEWNAMLT